VRAIVDWAKAQGIEFVCFKISEGRYSGDGKYDEGKRYVNIWREVAQELQFPYTGVYHWLSNDIPAEEQRDNAARRIGALYPNECIQLDIEEAGLDLDEIQHAISVWEETWPGRVFYYLGRYTAASAIFQLNLPADSWWWASYLPPSEYEGMVARHGPPFPAAIWQWGGGSQGAYCDPVQSRIDSNQVMNFDSLRTRCGYAGPVDPPPIACPVVTPFIPWEAPDMKVIVAPYVIDPQGDHQLPDGTMVRFTYAKFEGVVSHLRNDKDVLEPIRWIDGSRYAVLAGFGCEEFPILADDLRNVGLSGPVGQAMPGAVPQDDPIHNWVPEDFLFVRDQG